MMKLLKPITDRIRICLFGIAIAVLALWNPNKTLLIINAVIND